MLALRIIIAATICASTVAVAQIDSTRKSENAYKLLPLAPTNPEWRRPPRETAQEDPYAFTPVDREPQPKTDVRKFIVYPREALAAGIEGHVYLRFKVLSSGRVGKVIVEKSENKLFAQPAVRAMRQCAFDPAMKDGRAVAVWTSQAVEFRIPRNK